MTHYLFKIKSGWNPKKTKEVIISDVNLKTFNNWISSDSII